MATVSHPLFFKLTKLSYETPFYPFMHNNIPFEKKYITQHTHTKNLYTKLALFVA